MSSAQGLQTVFFVLNTPIVLSGITGADLALRCLIERHVDAIDTLTRFPGAQIPDSVNTGQRPVPITFLGPLRDTEKSFDIDNTLEQYRGVVSAWQTARASDFDGSLSTADVMAAVIRNGDFSPDGVGAGILYRIYPSVEAPIVVTPHLANPILTYPFIGNALTNSTTVSIAKRLMEYHRFKSEKSGPARPTELDVANIRAQ